MNSFTRKAMPRTMRLRDHGTSFTRSVAVPPLCCPARAGWITGQYPHNHGVFKNQPGYADLVKKQNVLPAWLDQAGYRTAFVGKYLNGTYDALGGEPAPGWDRWFGLAGPADYFHQRLSLNGDVHRYDRYLTPLLTARALKFLNAAAEDQAPFFLWLSHLAPHGQGGATSRRCPNPGPQVRDGDYRRFADEVLPRSPSFNERDVSDKPKPVRELPRLRASQIEKLQQRYRCTLAAMRAVDEGVAEIVAAVKKAGLFDETAIVFTDDNGYMLGEHRMYRGKANIYEESMRVPLVAHVPRSAVGGAVVSRVNELVGGIDLAPTFLELAGGAAPCIGPLECRTMDGRSLVDLLGGDESGWPENRGLLIEVGGRCHERGIRTARFVYAISDPQCQPRNLELYDLERDPYQLRNLGRSRPRLKERLQDRLDSLRSCTGIAGRDPLPPGGAAYCE